MAVRSSKKTTHSLKKYSLTTLLLASALCALVGGVFGYKLAAQQQSKKLEQRDKNVVKLKRHIDEFITYTLPSGWKKSFDDHDPRTRINIVTPVVNGNNATIKVRLDKSDDGCPNRNTRKTVWEGLKEQVGFSKTSKATIENIWSRKDNAYGLHVTYPHSDQERFYFLYKCTEFLSIQVIYTASEGTPDPKLKEQVHEFVGSIHFEKLNGDIPYN